MPIWQQPRDLVCALLAAYGRKVAAGARFNETTQRRWPDPDEGPWLLTVFWTRRNGRPVPAGMNLVPVSDEAADEVTLMTSTLRDLRIAEVVMEDREQLKHEPEVKRPREIHIAGMRPSTARRLHRAADIYLTAWHAGDPPTMAVARRMNVSHAAAANLVRRAREVGLLPATSAGVPQG